MKFFSTNFSQPRTKTTIVIFLRLSFTSKIFLFYSQKYVEAYLSNKTGSGDSIAENVSVTSNR